jgi:hypothetical protein
MPSRHLSEKSALYRFHYYWNEAKVSYVQLFLEEKLHSARFRAYTYGENGQLLSRFCRAGGWSCGGFGWGFCRFPSVPVVEPGTGPAIWLELWPTFWPCHPVVVTFSVVLPVSQPTAAPHNASSKMTEARYMISPAPTIKSFGGSPLAYPVSTQPSTAGKSCPKTGRDGSAPSPPVLMSFDL